MTVPERLLGGRYELGELLGYGGMAEVHRGRDLRLGREVAIKMLRTDLARDHTFQMRFRREAQNVATLNHPGIAAVYDTGEEHAATGEALPYIVMEFVAGHTLKDVLAAEGRLQPRRALEISADICAALEFSHRHGIIHRDVKPGNVMVTPNGQVKVMDFGIARDLASGATTMTQTSAVIGTAQYLSPEQARGEAVDARSDVYATGCVLFELLCGHPPFVGDSPVSVAYQHVREDPRAPSQLNPEVPPDVDAVVLKALAKNPANRYQSAAEMRADLLRAAGGRPVLATPVLSNAETALLGQQGEPARVGDPGRRRASTWVLIVLGVLGVLAVIALIVGLILTNQAPRQVDVPEVLGMSPEEAVAEIEGAELTAEAGAPVVGDCEREEGQVESQDPAAGTALDVNSTVTYSVCGGPEQVEVPQIVGSNRENAESLLEDAGLVGEFEEVDDERPEGEVISADPSPGTSVDVGSTVTVQVSRDNILQVPDVRGQSQDQATATLEARGLVPNVVEASGPPEDVDQVGTVAAQDPGPGTEARDGDTVTIEVYPAGADLEVPTPTVDQLTQTVTVSWDNGIYGGVTIDWGDDTEDTSNDSEGEEQHEYQVLPGESETFTITVTATDFEGRSVTHEVEIEPGP
ncbi:MAG: Stk1 family PASTA domain-containing Ser/Thr kinase [Micromonosporaceae bacterium]|nr:Stk1 family PASTA domain-containing Ser/Thr kinase [Micromonosporaceae bacterium]